jgi:hypothetical protein
LAASLAGTAFARTVPAIPLQSLSLRPGSRVGGRAIPDAAEAAATTGALSSFVIES